MNLCQQLRQIVKQREDAKAEAIRKDREERIDAAKATGGQRFREMVETLSTRCIEAAREGKKQLEVLRYAKAQDPEFDSWYWTTFSANQWAKNNGLECLVRDEEGFGGPETIVTLSWEYEIRK